MKVKGDITNEKCLYFNYILYLFIYNREMIDREIVNKVIVYQVYQTKLANYNNTYVRNNAVDHEVLKGGGRQKF